MSEENRVKDGDQAAPADAEQQAAPAQIAGEDTPNTRGAAEEGQGQADGGGENTTEGESASGESEKAE